MKHSQSKMKIKAKKMMIIKKKEKNGILSESVHIYVKTDQIKHCTLNQTENKQGQNQFQNKIK